MKVETILELLWVFAKSGDKDHFIKYGMDLIKTDDIDREINRIENIVLDGTLITHGQLKLKGRTREFAAIRHIVWYLTKELNPKIPVYRLAAYHNRTREDGDFGIKKVKSDMKIYKDVREKLNILEQLTLKSK